MRYVCMDTLKCEDGDRQTRANIDRAEADYAGGTLGYAEGARSRVLLDVLHSGRVITAP